MKKIIKKGLIIILFLIAGFFISPDIFFVSAGYQKCYKDNNCTIGEFLYDDFYTPIATASCNLTSRDPSGSIFLNSATLSAEIDGWYHYDFVASFSPGLYRSQICCTVDSEYLCLDKSFEIEASSTPLTKSDIASAVWDEPRANHNLAGTFGEALQNIVPSLSDLTSNIWNYSNRTLTAFGSLPSDIWNFSTRTLSSFGDLIANIWNFGNRTLTGNASNNTTNNYTTNNYYQNNIDTSKLAKKEDLDKIKNEVLYNQSLLEKLVNKPIVKNYLEEEPDVNLESKIEESKLYLTKLFNDSYFLDSKLGLVDVKWKEYDEKKIGDLLDETTSLSKKIEESAKKIKNLWNFSLADNFISQVNILNNQILILQTDFKTEGKSKVVLNDFVNLKTTVSSLTSIIGSAKDNSSKKTLYSKLNEIIALSNKFNSYLDEVNNIIANFDKFDSKTIQEKTNKITEELYSVSKVSRIAVLSSPKIDDQKKILKNKLLTIKGLIETNKKLLAKNTDKPLSNIWLEEGSIIFKTLLTNPSERIAQDVPLKYYLPVEVKKEYILDVDNGLKVEYDPDKKQYYVEGNYYLSPGESKVVSVRVQDIWIIKDEEIESLRRQVDDLIKPLEKTVYFGQGITIKSNINVYLDKIIASQKQALTPEAKIKSYYEAQILLKSVNEQIEKLRDLVTQASSFSSMAGFVGGAQAIAVWGIIVIMIAGFVFLVIYMRTLGLKNIEEKPVEAKAKKTKKNKKEDVSFGKTHLIRFAVIFFVLGSLSSTAISFTVFKIAYLDKNKKQEKIAVISPVVENKEKLTVKKAVLGESIKNVKKAVVKDLQGDYLKVRDLPKGEVIDRVYSDQVFDFLEEQDNWIKIKINENKAGWVAKEFVEIK